MLNFAKKDGVIKQLPPFPALEQSQQKDVEYLTFEEQQKVIGQFRKNIDQYLFSAWNTV